MELAALDLAMLDTYTRTWGLKEYSPMVLYGVWGATVTLIQWLDDDPRAAPLFTRGCELLSIIQRDIDGVRPVMQGMLALARTTEQRIPLDAMRYFEGFDAPTSEVSGTAVDFVMPLRPEVRRLLAEEVVGPEGIAGADVALLLEKWDSLHLS